MAKQLSLPERYVIERMLHQDYSFASIGRNLDRSASTIAREVLHYRCFTSRIPIMGENDCINRPSCQRNTLCPEMGVHGCFASRCKRCPEGIICTSICDNYDSFQCDLLDKPPYVCSNCKMQNSYFMCYHNYSKNHFLCVAFQATHKDAGFSPTSSHLSGFISLYHWHFFRYIHLHIRIASCFKCIRIILVLMCFSHHRSTNNFCFYSLRIISCGCQVVI